MSSRAASYAVGVLVTGVAIVFAVSGCADAASSRVDFSQAATITRTLVSASGPAPHRRVLIRVTVVYVPSNTSDWGPRPSVGRATRCYLVSPYPYDSDGPRGVSPDWRAVESSCPSTRGESPG